MKRDVVGLTFSVPYEIAAVRPLRETTLQEREQILKQAYYNTELIPQEFVYVDLKTDSGVSSIVTNQAGAFLGVGALETSPEMAPEANAAFVSLSQRFQEIFGFPHVVPCTQGRAAERIWAKIHVKEGSVVPGNTLFPSTRFHIESSGGKVIDVISDKAYDLFADDPFKGNVDLEKLEGVFKEHGHERVACIYVELCVNACGGHPVSLENLRKVKALSESYKVPLFLDASRVLENSYLVKLREAGCQERSMREIILETCSLADGCTLSALKDFLVREGGFIGARDGGAYQRAYFQSFLDGAQPSNSALEALGSSLEEIFRSDRHVAVRVEQVHYLWRKLAQGGVPVLHPPGGHGVFIDVKDFSQTFPPSKIRQKAWRPLFIGSPEFGLPRALR